MNDDWIDSTLTPALADLARRPWTAESLREFMRVQGDRINDAVNSAELTPDDGRLAWDHLRAAIKTIPGVTTVTHECEVTIHIDIEHRDR